MTMQTKSQGSTSSTAGVPAPSRVDSSDSFLLHFTAHCFYPPRASAFSFLSVALFLWSQNRRVLTGTTTHSEAGRGRDDVESRYLSVTSHAATPSHLALPRCFRAAGISSKDEQVLSSYRVQNFQSPSCVCGDMRILRFRCDCPPCSTEIGGESFTHHRAG